MPQKILPPPPPPHHHVKEKHKSPFRLQPQTWQKLRWSLFHSLFHFLLFIYLILILIILLQKNASRVREFNINMQVSTA